MTEQSILFEPAVIALLANSSAMDDLELFLFTLQLWSSSPPPIIIHCSQKVADWIPGKYRGSIQCIPCLDAYEGLTRSQMEKMPSQKGRPNFFYDFTEEKCKLMRSSLATLSEHDRHRGALFCDADLLWLGPLPLIPKGVSLMLSPHMIHKRDEARYGQYNAGLLWTNTEDVVTAWENACSSSRFFEQAALEELTSFQHSLFPVQINYGWWRMFQSPNGVELQQEKWKIQRDAHQRHCGIYVEDSPLLCIHTHWKTTDNVTQLFNNWVAKKLVLLKSQPKVRQLLTKLQVRF
jgi:hypothetical protein